MPDQNWQFELEEYIKQGEPDRAEKSEAWQTAIGLQAVDGLNTSAYLLDTAKDHIEGKITIDEAQQRIHSYYEQRTTRTEIENETKEADIVSARIAKLLGEKTFQFSPAEWITIHRRLFEGVFDHAGQIRKYNISKKELTLLSVVSPFSLYKNQFSNHRSRYTYSDTIHLLHPLHLVGGFELFRDTFLFGVFFYQPRKEGLCFFLYIGEVGM